MNADDYDNDGLTTLINLYQFERHKLSHHHGWLAAATLKFHHFYCITLLHLPSQSQDAPSLKFNHFYHNILLHLPPQPTLNFYHGFYHNIIIFIIIMTDDMFPSTLIRVCNRSRAAPIKE